MLKKRKNAAKILALVLCTSFSVIATSDKYKPLEKACEEHDYVIVGAGTAGLTLAYLLKKAGKDVVVIEAGRDVDTDPNILNAKSLNLLEEQFRNEYFWLGDAKPLTPQESRSTNVHANHYSGGRVLGGTSSTNDTIWWRMQQHTYDKAGGIFADSGYIDSIFKALETYTGTSQNPDERGSVGPIFTTQGPLLNGQLQTNPVAVKFNRAIQEAFLKNYAITIPEVIDYNTVNGSFVSNFGQLTVNPETLQRCSASIGFLATPIGKSLDIRLESQVLKLGFCGTKAKSVTYLHKGHICTITAKKKIILCAGHYSPSLLLQNGIGDASLLESLNIDVIKDNPEVGKNLKNHIFLPFTITINPEDAATIAAYPLAFKRINGGAALPEPGNINSAGRDYQTAILSVAGNIAVLLVIFVNPESTGNVTIVDKDPLLSPVVTLNYLSEEADRTSMVNAVTIAGQIMTELNAIDPTYTLLSNIANPVAYVNANTSAFHHWHGQCLLNKVVDENLHVIGVDNLMVADVSIFPLTDGNTQSMAYSAGCAAYTAITGDKNISFI